LLEFENRNCRADLEESSWGGGNAREMKENIFHAQGSGEMGVVNRYSGLELLLRIEQLTFFKASWCTIAFR
jgi:hypothetical protein